MIWLTNDAKYWHAPRNPEAGYAAFSVHHEAVKQGTMSWGPNMSVGTTKGREAALTLRGRYHVDWRAYSDLPEKNGTFQYALTCVGKFARRV